MPPTKLIQNVQIPVGKTVSQEHSFPKGYKKKTLAVRVLVDPTIKTTDTDLQVKVGLEVLKDSEWRLLVAGGYSGGPHNAADDRWGIRRLGADGLAGGTIRGFIESNKPITVDVEIEDW